MERGGDAEAVTGRVRTVLETIRQAEVRGGRVPGSVRLIAVTKSVPPDRIRAAIAAGVRRLGENRVQEALPKVKALESERGVTWHFLGRLQRRKVKSVIGVFEMIQSLDSIDLALEIDRRAAAAGLVQPVLLEVNLGGESTKTGFVPEAMDAAVKELDRLPHLAVEGLMTIPPPSPTAEEARPYFRRLRALAGALDGLGLRRVTMRELSMGMSQDYPVAIEEGATYVRVGTAIFGSR